MSAATDVQTQSARVPANILIAGEYAVLEKGGLGLAVAVNVHADAQFDAESREALRIQGDTPSGTFAWPGDNDFLNGLVDSLCTQLDRDPPAHGTIRINTDAFFQSNGM
jgi:mevalonate kinase